MSDLCWECRELWEKVGESWGHIIPFQLLHCHHEPKEKPKCFCERVNGNIGYHLIDKEAIKVNFCPECGKPLKKGIL